jgi:hypothetical protein
VGLPDIPSIGLSHSPELPLLLLLTIGVPKTMFRINMGSGTSEPVAIAPDRRVTIYSSGFAALTFARYVDDYLLTSESLLGRGRRVRLQNHDGELVGEHALHFPIGLVDYESDSRSILAVEWHGGEDIVHVLAAGRPES